MRHGRSLLVVCTIIAGAVLVLRASQAAPSAPSLTSAVDKLFARWTEATPGCAVGVGVGGRPVLERAYGMSDLEHDVRNRPETIFEAGSVSKQFTAAAVLLLVRDGRIGLDDPVRKYIPELPDYGTPLTVRHMLNHTSGLRDWGSLAGIAGWPRGSRAHTHDHVLDILGRQKALNFPPGSRYSYSNSGYNLSAVLVARVSGMSFAEFSRQRLFEPLGMRRTSWRDDYTRVLKDRAIAYAGAGTGFRQDMPFENVHGNGGLLTTVGDLLRWNENFVTPKVGDAAFVALQQTTTTFTSGAQQTYAFGLMIGTYKGLREVSHSGSTAGYRAFLTRFPDQHVSVAVLCNAGPANATALARGVADLYLGDRVNASATATPAPAETRGPLAGLARDDTFRPTATDLAPYAGTYQSDEIETVLIVEVRDTGLVIRRRPSAAIALRAHSRDRFEGGAGLGLVTFRRENGRVVALSVTQDRVWDLRFNRVDTDRGR
jgi:CubicO group peptidase (beta-lactamase class C family)